MQKAEAMQIVAEHGLTDEQVVKRNRHIATLKTLSTSIVPAAQALAEIRREKLYRPYKTWQEFCINECGFTRQRLAQVRQALEIREALPEKEQPRLTNERQARELAKVPEDKRVEVLNTAARVYSKDGKTPTAKDIKEAIFSIDNAIDMDGTPIPEGDASYYWRKRPAGEEKLKKIHDAGMAIKELLDEVDEVIYLECDLPNTIKALRAAYHMFKGGLPAYVCPKCKGTKPRDCTFCHGRGMIGTWKRKSKAGGKEFLDELQIRTF